MRNRVETGGLKHTFTSWIPIRWLRLYRIWEMSRSGRSFRTMVGFSRLLITMADSLYMIRAIGRYFTRIVWEVLGQGIKMMRLRGRCN